MLLDVPWKLGEAQPVLAKIVANNFEQRTLAVRFGLGTGTGKASAPVAALLGELGGVALAARVALALSADGAFVAPQGPRYGAEALLLLQPQRYRVASLSLNCW